MHPLLYRMENVTEERKAVKAYKRYRTEPCASAGRFLGSDSEAETAVTLSEEDAVK